MVGHGHAVDAGRDDEPAVGAADRVRVFAVNLSVPRKQNDKQDRHESDVEHVRVGVGGKPPEELAAGQYQTRG